MRRPLLALVLATLAGCPGNGGGEPDAEPVEILDPEPAGAPTGTVQVSTPALSCLGKPVDAPTTSAVELPGYVRLLSDPTALAAPPAAQVDAYTAGGELLNTGFADPTKQGRIAVPVSFTGDGFDGYVVVTQTGYLDYRFQTNRAVNVPQVNGYAWLMTSGDVDTWEGTLGVSQLDTNGILLGSVFDCEAFPLENVVITIEGDASGVYYPDGPTPSACPTGVTCAQPFANAAGATYSNGTGRFFAANQPPGNITVKAFGRLTSGGPLTLLASIDTVITADAITAVALQPRTGSH